MHLTNRIESKLLSTALLLKNLICNRFLIMPVSIFITLMSTTFAFGAYEASLVVIPKGEVCDGSLVFSSSKPVASGIVAYSYQELSALKAEDGEWDLCLRLTQGASAFYSNLGDLRLKRAKPYIISTQSSDAATKRAGDTLELTAHFSEPVSLESGGSPQIIIEAGNPEARASYHSTIDPTSMRFRYTVAEGDLASPVSITPLAPLINADSIVDAYGNPALSSISNVSITNAPSIYGLYTVDISWQPVLETAVNENGGGYEVLYSKDPTFNSGVYHKDAPAVAGVAPSSLEITHLTSGVWYFKVSAFSALSRPLSPPRIEGQSSAIVARSIP